MKAARDVLGDEVVDDLLGPLAGHTEAGDLVFRPSLRAAIGPSLLAVLGIGLLLVPAFMGLAQQDDVETGLGALDVLLILSQNSQYLFALAPALAPAINVLTTRYVLAGDGIRLRKQFLSKEEHKVTWEKVTALRHKRSLLDRLLGIERLDVIAYGERGATLHLVGLRDAAPLRDHVGVRMRQSATVDALFRSD
ncbi:MAG: PH domain-containing protein [Thermoplasmatota archaeon]